METARQVPGATIQIQTSAVQTTSRTWKIKTISLECETNFKYELEPSTLKQKNNNVKLINQISFLPLNNAKIFSGGSETHALSQAHVIASQVA